MQLVKPLKIAQLPKTGIKVVLNIFEGRKKVHKYVLQRENPFVASKNYFTLALSSLKSFNNRPPTLLSRFKPLETTRNDFKHPKNFLTFRTTHKNPQQKTKSH
jgi:hypothetical protein